MVRRKKVQDLSDTFTVTFNRDWYRENPGYATFRDYLEDFLEKTFPGHYTVHCTHRVIETSEQLEQLPVNAVARDARGWLWEFGGDGHAYSASFAAPYCIKEVRLPARVIWHPDWEGL